MGDDDAAEVVRQTLEMTPRDTTHWSLRSMAKAAGFAPSTIHPIWKAFNLHPYRTETFKLSTDPLFVEKVHNIIGLYLSPPNARSFCASTRRAGSRRWIDLSRCFPCARDKSSGARTMARANFVVRWRRKFRRTPEFRLGGRRKIRRVHCVPKRKQGVMAGTVVERDAAEERFLNGDWGP